MNDSVQISSKSGAKAVPANCEYRVQLTRTTVDTTIGGDRVWKMTIAVTSYNNVDPNLFLFQQRPALPQESATVTNLFLAVCNPVDQDEQPVGVPTTGNPKALFRRANVIFATKDRASVDDLWVGIQRDVTELIRTLAGTCELGDAELFTVGVL